mmetsp:Transcript_22926/g.34192  ORF Transcript_22926/g.34192 Transcript_22926/m.34192 type:complete len:136 (+) Transcript_22926:88-495(+)
MQAAALQNEISESLEDVKFALEGTPTVKYFSKTEPWMDPFRVDALISVRSREYKMLDSKISKSKEILCAACFPHGYFLATKNDAKAVKIHPETAAESLGRLMSALIPGYQEMFQEELSKKLKQAIVEENMHADDT